MATFLGLKADADNLARRTVDTVCYELLRDELNSRLRVTEMEAEADITINAEEEALPAGFLEQRGFYLDTNPRRWLEVVNEFTHATQHRTSGVPRQVKFTKEAAQFNPVPDGEYTGKLRYLAALAALSGDSDTNDVLDTYYRVYLYGALKHFASAILLDETRAAYWGGLFEAALSEAHKADERKRFGTGPLISKASRVG